MNPRYQKWVLHGRIILLNTTGGPYAGFVPQKSPNLIINNLSAVYINGNLKRASCLTERNCTFRETANHRETSHRISLIIKILNYICQDREQISDAHQHQFFQQTQSRIRKYTQQK